MNALLGKAENGGQGLDEERLGKAGHADQKGVAASQQRNQRLIDNFGLTENDAPDAFAHQRHFFAKRFDFADDGFAAVAGGLSGLSYTHNSSPERTERLGGPR